MMRYAARPPMAQSRITYYNKKTDEVIWYYDSHKTNERITVTETGRELMKKMIIHIPETGFRMVRYYGFYNSKEQDVLNRVHELSGQKQKVKRTHVQRKADLQCHYSTFITPVPLVFQIRISSILHQPEEKKYSLL